MLWPTDSRLGLFQKKTASPGWTAINFFLGRGEVRILHISGVCTGQIPLIFRDGWCLCSPSVPGSVLVLQLLLFKMVIWVYNIMLPHEGEIVLIYLPRLHSGSLQRFPRPLSRWAGGSICPSTRSAETSLSAFQSSLNFRIDIQKFKTLWT